MCIFTSGLGFVKNMRNCIININTNSFIIQTMPVAPLEMTNESSLAISKEATALAKSPAVSSSSSRVASVANTIIHTCNSASKTKVQTKIPSVHYIQHCGPVAHH